MKRKQFLEKASITGGSSKLLVRLVKEAEILRPKLVHRQVVLLPIPIQIHQTEIHHQVVEDVFPEEGLAVDTAMLPAVARTACLTGKFKSHLSHYGCTTARWFTT